MPHLGWLGPMTLFDRGKSLFTKVDLSYQDSSSLPGFWPRQFRLAVIETCAQLPCLQTGSMPWGRTTPQTCSHHGLHDTPALDELLTMAPSTSLPICCKGPNQASCGLDFNNHNLSPGTSGPSCPLPLMCKWQNCLRNEWGLTYQLFC